MSYRVLAWALRQIPLRVAASAHPSLLHRLGRQSGATRWPQANRYLPRTADAILHTPREYRTLCGMTPVTRQLTTWLPTPEWANHVLTLLAFHPTMDAMSRENKKCPGLATGTCGNCKS